MKFFNFLHNLFKVHSLEQDLRFLCYMSVTKLLENLLACRRHKGFKESCTFGNALDQVPKYCRKAVFLGLIFSEYPRSCLINIFIAAFEQIEDLCNRIGNTEVCHLSINCFRSILYNCFQFCIYIFYNTLIFYCSAEVFVCHRNSSVYKVSKCIGKVGVQTLYHQLPGNNTVILEWHLMKYEVTNCIYTKEINEFISIENISLGFTHLSVSLKQPRMSEYLFRKWKIKSHKEDWPVNCMETDDIFSDQMKVCRPQLVELLCTVSVCIISDSCDIVCKSIKPYIYNVLWIEIYRNSPLEGCSGYTQILKSRKEEVVHHLVLTGNRLNELRMCIDMLDQTICIFAHFEEICLFLCRLNRATAVRTFSIYKLRLCEERLARCTVHSFIMSLVNISLVVKFLENLLNLFLMIFICCTDEFVIRCIHQIPDSFDFC